MAVAILFLLGLAVIGGIGVNLFLRSWVREETRREAHLRDPNTHTLAYAVPNGVDPVTIESALARAGFESGVDRIDLVECIRIECDDSEREQARKVIETIPMTAYDGSQLQARRVVFEDER